MDLGEPSSYLLLEAGVPVFSSDEKRLGDVEHVLADEASDVFDGIVVDRSVLPGGHRFVDAPQVDRIHERGVVLTLTAGRGRGAAGTVGEPGGDGDQPGRGRGERPAAQAEGRLGPDQRELLAAAAAGQHHLAACSAGARAPGTKWVETTVVLDRKETVR